MAFKYLALGFSVVSVLALSACGEGYEAVPYSGSPYQNDRTAGKGVEYVRIKMMPEKGAVLENKAVTEPIAPEIEKDAPPPAETTAPVKAGDSLFTGKQKK